MRPTGLAAVLLLVTGCASQGPPTISDTPRRDLAGRPATSLPLTTRSPTPTCLGGTPSDASRAREWAARCQDRSGGGRGVAATGPAAATTTTASERAGAHPGAAAPSYRVVATLTDASGDQGLEGPGFADLRRVTLEDGGPTARVTVEVGAGLPAHAASRESLGLGVDLYDAATETESHYQLFADGGPDGWFAYLHTPQGFVRYPGTFAVTGDRLVFTVPWSSLGGRTSGWFSSFADWTRGGTAGTLGGNRASRDDAPGLGSRSWSR